MKIQLTHKKPIFSLDSQIHCTFRSSKAYLWGLIADRLHTLQENHSSPLNILDAACHALITRQMFPESSVYYGLDISVSRLKKAFVAKSHNDILYHADLCHPLGLDGCFDVVVSCNTFSHLPTLQQDSALRNLTQACVFGGSLFINSNITSPLQSITQYLASHFSSLEVVYFDSYRSLADEEASNVTSSNVRDKIVVNEFNIPNDACFHSQVLFIAHGFNVNHPRSSPPGGSNKITRLNQVPQVKSVYFESDSDILHSNYFLPSAIFLMTSKLLASASGQSIRTSLLTKVSSVSCLDDFNAANASSNSSICILGLENEWIDDLASARIMVNNIREVPGVSLNFLHVKSRDNSICTPSLISTDV